MKYTVSISNVGNLHYKTLEAARIIYDEYIKISKSGFGRAGNESVTLLKNDEVIAEYVPVCADNMEFAG